ncbi:hypothetical protein, partial [Clostridium sp. 2-1]|uniref:hypothetical protein n=1 Tax=Clostridium sp. 2-1 TaxID=2070758 RepID=UPI001A9A4E90
TAFFVVKEQPRWPVCCNQPLHEKSSPAKAELLFVVSVHDEKVEVSHKIRTFDIRQTNITPGFPSLQGFSVFHDIALSPKRLAHPFY